jgi:energy-coupling factor transporter ATP-binding protein EcfA2
MVTAQQNDPSVQRDDPSHLLRQLRLPSRYESLVAAVGAEVAQLLVEPSEETLDVFRRAALHIRSRGRGLFLPIYAESGTGKTTLVSNLAGWVPDEYGPTARLAGGEVSADRLRQAVAATVQDHALPFNDARILVINVDDRESDPPTDKELSQIKSFVREAGEGSEGLGSRALVVWPETSRDNAVSMAQAYEQRAGKSPVEIPTKAGGPGRETWPGLATATLKLANAIDHLGALGVDPDAYEPEAFPTVGDYLDKISTDFVDLLDTLLKSTRKPVRLVVAFASESGKAGVLSELASGYRYGLVDADKLVAATPNSVIGKWWKQRMGLLIQTIVRLDARVVFIAPTLSVAFINRYGPDEAKTMFAEIGTNPKPPSEISTYFERSDFGRLLQGTASAAAEIRGNPAADATATFALLSENVGFGSGQDKKLNRALGDFLTQAQSSLGEIRVEQKADGIPLIPDVSLSADHHVTCIELHWRSGDFLVSANRSSIAQYVLGKLKSYALELGWTSN